ncbi:hypothetical protein M9H77_24327 [Catharanthus roseus]|uniref:Uncharacterized protein n=1 Tax=Catharanthus roseus TaxID=4058 RepID=A0ACC0AVS8_CATRO|nr:hypothetical protein M9H77_24327 [Catharanthus roseus]
MEIISLSLTLLEDILKGHTSLSLIPYLVQFLELMNTMGHSSRCSNESWTPVPHSELELSSLKEYSQKLRTQALYFNEFEGEYLQMRGGWYYSGCARNLRAIARFGQKSHG